MEDLCTLAHYHPDDLSTHAVSLAFFARALNDAYESGAGLDRIAFHRAADLALAVYHEEKARFESVDCTAPLLDRLYLKAFIPGDEPAEESEDPAESIARRFHAELLRLLYLKPSARPEPSVGNSLPQSI